MLLNQINIMKTNLPQTQNLCSPRYSSNILSGSSVLPRVKFHPQYLVFVLQLEKNTIIFINVKWYTIFLSALYNIACHSEACPISPNSDISSSFRIAMYVYNRMVFWLIEMFVLTLIDMCRKTRHHHETNLTSLRRLRSGSKVIKN